MPRSEKIVKILTQNSKHWNTYNKTIKDAQYHNIREWTGRPFAETQALADDRNRWIEEVYNVSRPRPYDAVRH